MPVVYIDKKTMNPIQISISDKENINMSTIEGLNKCLLCFSPFEDSVEAGFGW